MIEIQRKCSLHSNEEMKEILLILHFKVNSGLQSINANILFLCLMKKQWHLDRRSLLDQYEISKSLLMTMFLCTGGYFSLCCLLLSIVSLIYLMILCPGKCVEFFFPLLLRSLYHSYWRNKFFLITAKQFTKETIS